MHYKIKDTTQLPKISPQTRYKISNGAIFGKRINEELKKIGIETEKTDIYLTDDYVPISSVDPKVVAKLSNPHRRKKIGYVPKKALD